MASHWQSHDTPAKETNRRLLNSTTSPWLHRSCFRRAMTILNIHLLWMMLRSRIAPVEALTSLFPLLVRSEGERKRGYALEQSDSSRLPASSYET